MSSQDYLDSLSEIFSVVDNILNSWEGKGCYQIPLLMQNVAVQMNWDNKESKNKDGIIRDYVRCHNDWRITRGAGGGIMRAADMQNKLAAKEEKSKIKKEIMITINEVVAKKNVATISAIDAPANDNAET